MRHEPRITALTGATPLPEPVWHILKVTSGREAKVCDRLALAGIETAYPTRKTIKRDAQNKIHEIVRADVPGLVFAKFRFAPHWHEIKARKLIIGVFCDDRGAGLTPYRATANDVRKWMGIPTVEEELEAERLAALRVHPGDRARVLVGADLVLAVLVTDVRNGRVYWEAGGMKGDTVEGRAEKVA